MKLNKIYGSKEITHTDVHTGVVVMQRVGKKILGLLAVAFMAVPMMASASTVTAQYTSSDFGGLVANFTLTYTGSPTGFASSGSGDITAPGINAGATQLMTLILSTDGDATGGPTYFTLGAIGGGWGFDEVWNDGGSSTPPPAYLGTWGLVFKIADGSYFNPWYNGASNYVGARIFAGGGSQDVSSNATLSAVPVPAAAWLFGSALGVMRIIRRRPT